MKQKIVLLVVIAILLAAGYVAWDRSFREEITQQDIELVEKHLQSFNYGTKNLQVFNVYDKYDHAKFIYAQSDAGFSLFYKNTGNIGINKINTLLRAPNCPFVLFVGNKKLGIAIG